MAKRKHSIHFRTKTPFSLRESFLTVLTISVIFLFFTDVSAMPTINKTRYHTWDEVNAYLNNVANDPQLSDIVELMQIGTSREGRPLWVLRISKEGIEGKDPDTKPAAFIMGAHHAREHVSKEAVLALIDKIIHGYGKPSSEGQAITYLVDAGTFYLMPWVNPDGGMHEYFHNPEQRKTNYAVDEPQIGAAACNTCGDGLVDEDSPDILSGDVGEISRFGATIAFADNGIISRHLQLWYEDDDYTFPVVDARAGRIQPGYSPYTFNYEGYDPDGDGLYYPYSGEDFVGGTDPNRNYGEPLWGDCFGDEGCSWLSGAQTYCGPAPFSEPETAGVEAFLMSHPNIVTLESLHSGVNEIYPPWWLYPDDPAKTTMDESYHDSMAQYISRQTGYEVLYGGQYAVKGSTIGYSYIGSGQHLGGAFWPGGILSMLTEIYGMGSDSGSAEAVRDWFPYHWQQFDTTWPQGVFLAWSDFPWCTTCNPDLMPGPLAWFNYTQYTEYFVFNSNGRCGGVRYPGIFHCDYWGIGGSPDYYADLDIFAYFNPPSANRCYQDWNCKGAALVRTIDRQLKHLLYRLYVAPFIRVNDAQTTCDGTTLDVAIENKGFLRSSVMTAARDGQDPFEHRYYDYGLVEVLITDPLGFTVDSANPVNIGWLGGGRADDPEPNVKAASFNVSGLGSGDSFTVYAASDKTGQVRATVDVVSGDDGNYKFRVVSTNYVRQPSQTQAYFLGIGPDYVKSSRSLSRSINQIRGDIERAERKRSQWKRIEGPFDIIPGYVKGITVKKYH